MPRLLEPHRAGEPDDAGADDGDSQAVTPSAPTRPRAGQLRRPYAYRVHRQISLSDGFLPYIRMPTR